MSDKNHKKRAGCAGGEGVGSAKGVLMNRKKSQEKTENTVCFREDGVGSAKEFQPRG
jgi:hypothetical protein